MSQFKKVSYAYPTSTDAAKHGFKMSGCWIVEATGHQTRSFPTLARESAFYYAGTIPLDYDRFSFLPVGNNMGLYTPEMYLYKKQTKE